MVYSGKSAPTTVSQFTRQKKIHINSSADGALTDYQIKRTITYESAMQADFDDIRFNEINGDYINCWLESKTDSSTADFWIKTDVPASGGKDIYMFYGNSTLSSNSDGDNTFIQYTGNTTSSYSLSKTILNNVIFETSSRYTGSGGVYRMGLCSVSIPGPTNDYIYTYMHSNSAYGRYGGIRNSGVNESNTGWHKPIDTINVYYCYKEVVTSNSAAFFRNGVKFGYTLTTGFPNENMGMMFHTTASTSEQAWAFIRKYTDDEPTTSIGDEQHQRRTPQIIG